MIVVDVLEYMNFHKQINGVPPLTRQCILDWRKYSSNKKIYKMLYNITEIV